MATLALGALGSAIAGPVGGFIGTIAGGVIDNLFLSALFPPENQVGPRINGINVTTGDEGSPINWFIGPRNRVGVTIIWLDELQEIKNRRKQGKGSSGSVSTFEYFISFAALLGEVDVQSISRLRKVFGNSKVIFDDVPFARYKSLTFYDGSQTTPDPLIESKLGSGNVPAFVNKSYFTVDSLFLGDFANSFPNLQGIVEQQSELSIGEAITFVMRRAGIDQSDIDVTRVSGCFRGLNVPGIVQTSSTLEQILFTYAVTMQKIGRKFVFSNKAQSTPIIIDNNDISETGVINNEDYGRLVPTQSNVRHVDDDAELQPGQEKFRDATKEGSSRNDLTLQTNVVLTAKEANIVARRNLFTAQVENREVEFNLPPKYLFLAAGDILSLDRDGRTRTYIAREVEYANTGLVTVKGVETNSSLYIQTGTGQSTGFTSGEGYVPPELDTIIADTAALTDLESDAPVVHVGVNRKNEADQFIGATVFVSTDNITFSEVVSLEQQMITGTVNLGLPDGNPFTIDETTVVEIEMDNGQKLESATETEVLNGLENIAAIQTRDGDWEIFGFVNVTQISTTTFQLRRILRGLRGTEVYIPNHSLSGAKFILLTGGANRIGQWATESSFIGSTVHAKGVAEGDTLGSVNAISARIRGRSVTPFAPANLKAVQRTRGAVLKDFEITWQPRTKKLIDAFGSASPVASDETGIFKVQIRPGGIFTPILREEAVFEPRFLYTQEMRDADESFGWTSDDGFSVSVQAQSTIVGDGHRAMIIGIREQ